MTNEGRVGEEHAVIMPELESNILLSSELIGMLGEYVLNSEIGRQGLGLLTGLPVTGSGASPQLSRLTRGENRGPNSLVLCTRA